MEWLRQLFVDRHSIATCMFILALVISTGMALGAVRFGAIRLGVAGVLFSGLAFGHFGLAIDHTVLEFAREFGLVLFVYAIGLTVGPGFFAAFREHGLRLNAIAGSIVLLGALLTIGLSRVLGIAPPIAVGIFSGAGTNTPSLAAATQTLREHPPAPESARSALAQTGAEVVAPNDRELLDEVAKLPGLGYAVTYPLGVLGIILTLAALRFAFRVDPVRDAESIQRILASRQPVLERRSFRITNPNLEGIEHGKLPGLPSLAIAISRVSRGGQQFVATSEFRLAVGDIVLAVGTPDSLDQFRMIAGEPAGEEAFEAPSQITHRWIVLTRKKLVGQSLEELDPDRSFGVQITRIRRAETELPPAADLRLAPGDQLFAVGFPEGIAALARAAGDAPRSLEQPELLPVFAGIALGVLVGSIPIAAPGMPTPIKLGLAGGPLLVAILLARWQRLGPLVFYLPRSASMLLRELGIALFLAAVGLKSGDRLLATLAQGDGFLWMAWGSVVTLVPLLVVSGIAHWIFGIRYSVLIGVLAGSMTDPPALAFANAQTQSEVPSIAYATVYPVTMILRVICAQAMMLVWTG